MKPLEESFAKTMRPVRTHLWMVGKLLGPCVDPRSLARLDTSFGVASAGIVPKETRLSLTANAEGFLNPSGRTLLAADAEGPLGLTGHTLSFKHKELFPCPSFLPLPPCADWGSLSSNQ